MEIKEFKFHPHRDPEQATTMGLRIQKDDNGKTWVNLFAVDENHGPLIAPRIWRIAGKILEKFLPDETLETINWTLTTAYVTSTLHFRTLNGQPYMLSFSDKHVVQQEEHTVRDAHFTLGRYMETFEGQPPIHPAARKVAVPDTIFCVPCPKTRGGVLYCKPAFFAAGAMARKPTVVAVPKDHEIILVDTAKMAAALRESGYRTPLTASFGISADDYSRIQNPRNTGIWTYSRSKGLHPVKPGDQAVILIANDWNVPYIPITVEKSDSMSPTKIRDMRAAIGFEGPK